jgi:hypothetical protein
MAPFAQQSTQPCGHTSSNILVNFAMELTAAQRFMVARENP